MQATILFVEDHDDLRDNVAQILALEGYAVVGATDGCDALEQIAAGLRPDLIISDIMMPRMDGYQFFETVRRDYPRLRAIPFIFLTARGSRHEIALGKGLGADDYLVKPFDPAELIAVVHGKLRRTAELRAEADESLAQARRTLIRLLAHELHTPLTYVSNGFELLAEELRQHPAEALSEDMRVSLALIRGGTERLNRLAEQTALYARIVSGQVNSQVRSSSVPLSLGLLLYDALVLLNDLTCHHVITIQHRVPETETLPVQGIRSLLITAIGEVIRNAVQYAPRESTITIALDRTPAYALLSVRDEGPGIDPAQQATVWDAMVQLERDTREQQGVGLGLPIVKGIVEAHGGSVELDSRPGAGTRVTLRLPLAEP
jgi:two-component system sensor kinase